MSTAAWIICGFGGTYMGLIAAIGIRQNGSGTSSFVLDPV